MDHISKNKNLIGSIETPFDREYHPDEKLVKFPRIAIHFYGRGWLSK
jgi:hypothetical protein